ncbi:MAG TPA: hypothetical protein DCE56_16305 [Cyanobacteria bacterium UBA8553]|nr:hypothetical protein [Cyanobacteria bacterium UBA8553]
MRKQTAEAFAATGDKLGQAMALSNLSLTYQQIGEWEKAEDAIASGITLLKNSPSSTQQQKILAQTLNIQGRLQFTLGQTEQALTTWKSAADTYKQAGDETGAIRSTVNQAQALQTLGNYNKAWRTLIENGKALLSQKESIIKASVWRNLGDILRVVGEPNDVGDRYWLSLWKDWQKSLGIDEKLDSLEKSKQILQQSLEIAQRLQISQEIGENFLSLGNTFRALAATKSNADQYYEEILAASANYEKAQKIAAPTTKVQAQLNQLSLLLEAEQWLLQPQRRNIAREFIAQIQSQLQDQIGNWRNIEAEIEKLPASRRSIYARINLAQSLTKAKSKLSVSDDQEIVELLERALQQAKNIKDGRGETYALGTLGAVYEQNRQYNKATDLTRAALNLSQAIKAADISYRWEWQIGRLLKAQGNKKDAIEYYGEAFKTLRSLRSDLVAVNSDVQFSFRDSVEPVYRELVGLLLQFNPSQENIQQARQLLEALQIAELENFFREACLTAKPQQIEQIDPSAAVFYPIILKDRLEVIVSLPGQSLRRHTTEIPQTEVENTIDRWLESLNPFFSSRDRLQVSQKIYDWLIRPIEAELTSSSVKTLVFILDGSLRNLPMAALHNGQYYLVEKYNIAVTPGLQLFEARSLAQAQLKVLTAGLTEARQGFAALPGVKLEVEQIAAELPARTFLDREFTEKNLQKQIQATSFPIIHLATHGQFSSNPEQTFILTWDEKIKVKEFEDLLRFRQQGNADPIELLVLSACQTAAGDKRAALGLAGVAVRSGARSTLATLWSVKDQSTAELMSNFYQELSKGVRKAEALRTAQLNLLKQSKYQHPFYWAPFVLVGNWL